MIGILCEKPSAKRNFEKALGGAKGKYNGEEYVIVASRGHLYEFKDPAEQVNESLTKQYKSWKVENLPWNEKDFSWKRERKADVSDVIKTIKTTLKDCDEICIATDVDPSGEGGLLAWEIIEEGKLKAKKYTRMYFTDESQKEIQKAFVNRKELGKTIDCRFDDEEYRKAYYRSKWDFLSMQWTRIATACSGNQKVPRQGRLKSAMVKITGDGLKALEEYKPVPFFQNRFKDENGVVYTSKDERKYGKKEEVPQNYHDSPVVKDSSTRKKTAPPKFLDLAALASRLSSKGIKAKDVLAVYQKMYEDQIVSYPRTEDKTITPEQFKELLPLVDRIAAVVGVDPKLLTERKPRKTHVKAAGAHGANRPGSNVPKSLSDLAKYGSCAVDIYTILAKNYLATLAPDYEYEEQKGHIKDYPKFIGSTNVPKVMGWKQVYDEDAEAEEESTTTGLGTIGKPFIYEGKNPKPPTPTMKWLMKQLEKRNVGTGATRTSIYADVTNEKTKYPLLIEKKGKLSMAECGEISYQLLPNTHIGNLEITERLMGDMEEIAKGKKNADDCLHQIQQMIKEDIETMRANSAGLQSGGKKMSETYKKKEKYTGIWDETGEEISFTREFRGYRFSDKECEALLRGEDIEIKNLVSPKTGKKYGIHGKLTPQEYNGYKYIGFESMGFVEDVPSEWCGHKFTAKEKTALKKGEEILLKDCVSKKTNKKFECKVTYGKTDRGNMGIIPNFG